MKRAVLPAALLLILGLGILYSFLRRPAQPDRPLPPPVSIPTPKTTVEPPATDRDLRESLQTRLPDETAALLAARLRFRARTEPAALELLLKDLRDVSLSMAYRSVVALVLGTLDDPRVQAALATELQLSREPSWTSLLLHALGAQKGGDTDSIFDRQGAPYVYPLAGLHVCIKTDFGDESLRRLAAGFLADDNLDVRRAAARSLIHSGDHEDLRKMLRDRLPLESDDGIRAGHGFALAQWMMSQPIGSAERDAIVQTLFSAARAEDGAVRARTELALKQAPMTPAELEGLRQIALTGPLQQQLWSLTILSGRPDSGDGSLEATFSRLTTAGAELKVREYALRALGGLRTETATATLLKSAEDPEWNVRLAAIQGLAGRRQAEAVLTRVASSDPDERVRQAAARALKP